MVACSKIVLCDRRRGARRAARASGEAGDGPPRPSRSPRRQAREFVRRGPRGRGLRHDAPAAERQSCDVELLCNGGFSPLDGFMDEETQVGGRRQKLPSGLMFSLPVVSTRTRTRPGSRPYSSRATWMWPMLRPQVRAGQASRVPQVLRHVVLEHPGTQMVAMERGKYYLGGKLTGLNKSESEFLARRPRRCAPPGRRRHRRLPAQPRAPRALRASRDWTRQRRATASCGST